MDPTASPCTHTPSLQHEAAGKSRESVSLKYRNFRPVRNFVTLSKRESAPNHTTSDTCTCCRTGRGRDAPGPVVRPGLQGQHQRPGGAGSQGAAFRRPKHPTGVRATVGTRPQPPVPPTATRMTLPHITATSQPIPSYQSHVLWAPREAEGRPFVPHQDRCFPDPPPTALQPRERGKKISFCFSFWPDQDAAYSKSVRELEVAGMSLLVTLTLGSCLRPGRDCRVGPGKAWRRGRL